MLFQCRRLRRWPSIDTSLHQRLLLTEKHLLQYLFTYKLSIYSYLALQTGIVVLLYVIMFYDKTATSLAKRTGGHFGSALCDKSVHFYI